MARTNNVIEVREFQRLYYKLNAKKDTTEKDIFDYSKLDNRYVRLSSRGLYDELYNFIKEYDDAKSDAAEPYDFLKEIFDKDLPTKKAIQAQNYVGLIQLKSGAQIQILPKIVLSNDDGGNEKIKSIFMKMLLCLPELPGKLSGNADLEVTRTNNIYEFFIRMFAKETLLLVNRGLRSGYVQQENNLNYFKGKLKVSEHIKYNSAHKERFYVQYDEFMQNRPENRLIRSALMKLLRATSDSYNYRLISRLLMDFDDVEPSANYARDMACVSLDRSTGDYTALMKWVKLFLFNKSFTTFAGSVDSKALLFPMEKIFEAYVAKEIRKHFSPDGWSVTVNKEESRRRNYLFYDMNDSPENPHGIFKLEPDIVLRKSSSGDKRVIIMDTKWKQLVPQRFNEKGILINYNISQGDMYQMYAYSMRYMLREKLSTPPEVWLLYPKSEKIPPDTVLHFESEPLPDGEPTQNVKVRAFFVDLENIEESLDELSAKLE